jgi:hypothetical protein
MSEAENRSLNFPYRRFGWISQFELDRGLAENPDDSRLLAALPHAVIVRRVRDAAHEAAGGDRHSGIRLEILARVYPPSAGNNKAESVGDVGVRRAHVPRIPLD